MNHFGIEGFINYTADVVKYIDNVPANVSIFTRKRLLDDESMLICLERVFEMDEASDLTPTKLRRQFKQWLIGTAPIIVIALAPLHNVIISTNFDLLNQDVSALIKGLSQRKGEIKIVSSGSDELIEAVQEILRAYRMQITSTLKIRSSANHELH